MEEEDTAGPPEPSPPPQPPEAPEFLVRCASGDVIFREGEPGDAMFLIQRGQVGLFREEQGEGRRLALLEEGDFFGETAVLEQGPRVLTARALTACEILRIDSVTFGQMVRMNPEVPIRMLRKLSRRLREIQESFLPTPEILERSAELPIPTGIHEPSIVLPAYNPQERPRLVHDSGTEFPLSPEEITFIGRPDPATGFEPHVELRAVDPQRSTSRRHARLLRRAGSYFLVEETGVANGTFVNGQAVTAGEEAEVHDGDIVRFGLVDMVFRTS
jgi:pSer/pThr/pTyr-binding forkhead associated (FHA) protein